VTPKPNPCAWSLKIKPPGTVLLLLITTFALFFVVMAALASPAHANTLKVTNKQDKGPGSLRRAINNAAPRGDTITFATNVTGTITLAGELYINKDLTIKGPGAGKLAVSGNNRNRVIYIDFAGNVRISGLTITKGNDPGNFGEGGGIDNDGNLTLTKDVVRSNFTGGYGGGIDNEGTLKLLGSTVKGNTAHKEGGGIYNDGILTVGRSTISGNEATTTGGGIYSYTELPGDGPLKATITNSTISGNFVTSATGAGGGVYNEEGLTEIRNSTITNNWAPEDQGSGVANNEGSFVDVTTRVSSTIIADNPGGFGSARDFVSDGYNLIGSGDASIANRFNKTGDQLAVSEPGLGPLTGNGGPTWTHALLNGSPAIDRGNPNCPPPATDQRGVQRPQGARCDVGSFERLQP
jgi:Right handed beta helix region